MNKKEYIEKYGEEAYRKYLEYHKQYHKQYYQQHKEEKKQHQKQYNQQHREEINRYKKQYYQQHREERNEYIKQYNQQHREEINQYKKQYSRQYRHMFAYCIPEQIEQIENYGLAKESNFDGWHIHHRLETNNSDGEKRLVNLSRPELIALDMYYNRPANELIFLTKSEHMKLHRTKQRCSKE